MIKSIKSLLCLGLIASLIVACSPTSDIDDVNTDENPDDNQNQEQTDTRTDISILASKFYNSSALTVSVGEQYVTISSQNQPDHKSMYYAQSNALYESYSEPNNPDFFKNRNSIQSQKFVYKIPRYPEKASSHAATPFGPMGISVNSVAFFNQNAAPGDDILEELNTFDQYEGHPTEQGIYHYHIEPVWLTQTKGEAAFLGLLLDGFPVYGPKENGKQVTNSDLDDYHGHTSATAEFPNGIYHYHITDDLPWINGDGYYGTPGTITQ